MSDDLNNGALRLAVAQICQSMGWDALNKSTHDLLTEVLQKYMVEIAKCAHDYSQLYCHTEPSLDDLGLAFKHTGVVLHELEDFVSQVDQVPFNYQLPQFPLPKPNLLQHPRTDVISDRPEFYHEHLPPLIKALQQNEDEREGSKDESQGIEDPSSQFLRNEIKTVGKETENESIENTPQKRALTIKSPELETDVKRRRLEGPFGKHTNEKKLDILQVLQEKNNSISLSPSPSPDFIPTETKNKAKSIFTFSSTSTPAPAIPPTSSITPKKGTTKKEKASKEKKLLSPPSSQTLLVQKQPKLEASPTTEKKSDKSKNKRTDSPSNTKKSSSPVKLSSPPTTQKALQQPFSKPKTPKKTKVKKENQSTPTVPNEPPVFAKITFSPPPSKKWRDEDSSPQATPMPKLIIKPMKLEKNIHSEYSVSSVPPDDSLGLEKKKSKTKVTPGTSSTTDETKPKKKKKKKGIDIKILGSPPTEQAMTIHVPSSEVKLPDIPTRVFNDPAPAVEKGGEIVKKKKKKHKEKDRDKSKPKKVKEPSSEPSIPIPTLKLKLENTPTTTISSSQAIPTTKISAAKSSEPTVTVIPKEEMSRTLIPKKERTVITETLSTTVQIYYCPACRLADDGSFMIGCDTCDSWYHGGCVGIANDPGGNWYCEVCMAKKAKKKKKKKKAKANQS